MQGWTHTVGTKTRPDAAANRIRIEKDCWEASGMSAHMPLDAYLAGWSAEHSGRLAIAAAVTAIAGASADIAARIAHGPLLGSLSGAVGGNADGDQQTELDVWANDRVIEALGAAPVTLLASEELPAPLTLRPD